MSTAAVAPCSSTLSSLETRLRSAIGCAPAHSFSLSDLNIPAIEPFLARTVGPNGILQDAEITVGQGQEPGQAQLALSGTLPLLGAGLNASLTATDSAAGVDVECSFTQPAGSAISLHSVLAQLAPHASMGLAPNLEVTGFSLAFGTSKSDFAASASCQWPVQVGAKTLVVQASVAVTSTSATLSGELILGGATLSIVCDLTKDANSITGTWTDLTNPVGWDQLVQAAGLPASLDLPKDAPNPRFTTIELTIDISGELMELLGQTVDNAIGFVVLKKSAGKWGFAFGVERPNACEPGDISADLKALDFLQLSGAHLVFSSYTDPSFTLPALNANTQPLSLPLTQGLNLAASLTIDGSKSGVGAVLGDVFGGTTSTLSAAFDKDVVLTAIAGGALKMPRSPLTLNAPQLTVTMGGASGFDISLLGSMQFPFKGHTLELEAVLEVSTGGLQMTAAVQAAPPIVFHAPFGLNGVGISAISAMFGLTTEPFGIQLGGGVDFSLGGSANAGAQDAFALGLQVGPDEVDVLYLVGTIGQSVNLETVAYTVLPEFKVPPPFTEVSFSNLGISFCADSAAKMADGTPIPVGFSLGGEITAFGWSMRGALSLHPPKTGGDGGVHGSMQMDPIHLANGLVSITGGSSALMQSLGFTGTGAAFSFTLPPAAGSRIASGALSVNILGAVSATVSANIDTTGFWFQMLLGSDVNGASLTVSLPDKLSLNATATLGFHLVLDIDLSLPDGRKFNHHIDAQFAGSVTLKITNAQSIALDIVGHFDGRSLPGVHLDENSAEVKTAMANLGKLIRDKITAEASEIYKDVVADATKALGDVKSEADDADKTLQAGAKQADNDAKHAVSDARDVFKKKLHL